MCLFHASQSIKPEKVNTISAISRCVSISSQIKEGKKDWVRLLINVREQGRNRRDATDDNAITGATTGKNPLRRRI